ncbi:short-chain-enoyl-CoA hydratase [Papillibacter cinnamivorans]|uniref:short-chain-enoyl-CoA hydratase n=1 Tax=Papillibacter cinnamivorans DSM 12816 TaxID=1122930 RepID=A0A1W1ZKE0_9FIRM|nr:short-chain-enoyl-CoA hydratase [Papillibacter cinnamivorans]SMC49010.1 enoyl-CoA hydratase [Papillibacter cinnamivorans DSM 12816]
MYVNLEKQGNIGILTMNRPEALNAINADVLKDLDAALNTIEQDEEIYVVIVTGGGKSFIAGADIAMMKDLSVAPAKVFITEGQRILTRLEDMGKPVIAAVNGFALGGGCELAMCCDIRIASEKAKFGQPEAGLGITPGFGGTQRLPRIVGLAKAKELMWTCRIIGAQEALEIGLVSKVVPAEELMNTAMELAKAIAANAQVAVRQCKAAANRGMQCDIKTGLAYEAEAVALCFATEDQKDAMQAFVEKRKLNGFKNR